MPHAKTPQPAPPASAEALARAAENARLALAFDTVFGQREGRTAAQRLVMEHLQRGADDEADNSFDFRTAKDGLSQLAAGIHLDGAKSIFRIIARQLAKAATLKAGATKPKPTVKR